MSGPPFQVRVTHEGLDEMARALRREADGKELRKELAANLRNALRPGAEQAKGSIMGMVSLTGHPAPALRSAIAKKIRPEVKLGGRWSGARVKAFKTKNVRNFPNAPKRTNRASGWRHPVYGNTEHWVTQRGKLQWFDRALAGRDDMYRQAVHEAMEAMARRIAERAG